MSDDDGLRRLATLIRQRRIAMGLTQAGAAARGGLSGTTWRMAEKYAEPVSDLSAGAIARALGWRADSIELILKGGEPVLDPEQLAESIQAGTGQRGVGGDNRRARDPGFQKTVDRLSDDDWQRIKDMAERLLGEST